MTPEELSEDARRMLGLAMQILEDLPEWLQPASNMADMRTILAGGNTGRDELIISEAVNTALAWRTHKPQRIQSSTVSLASIIAFTNGRACSD